MPTDTEPIADTVKRLLTDLVLPRLDALTADLQRIEQKLDAPQSMLRKSHKPGLLSPQGRAYIDALVAEINEKTERDAEQWAQQQKKES